MKILNFGRTGFGSTGNWTRASAIALFVAGALFATGAQALDVATQTDWDTAVAAVAAAGAGSTVSINFTSGFTLTSSLSTLAATNADVTVNITGNGQTVNGAAAFQGIQVSGANAPTVNISSLAITNTAAIGGGGQNGQNGYLSSGLAYGSGAGGGGGLAAGAGLLVGSGANVTLSSVTFTGNTAKGGAGGNGGSAQSAASSPTGGDGGQGGAANNGGATGGGGAGGTGGNTGTQGTAGTAGSTFGAGGGGGGGSGTTNSTSYTPNNNGGAGQASGGGSGGRGGDGVTNNGGSGGPGSDGADGGNGGAARGGAIYVQSGGTLTILDTPITGAAATGGAGGTGGTGQGPSNAPGSAGATGAGTGAGLFLDGVRANVGVSAGTVAYANTIGGTGIVVGGVTTALNKTGAGTLTLSATNTFSGNVNISAGTVQVAGTANLGNAANDVVMSNGSTLAVTATSTFASGRAFMIAGTGTFDIASGTTSTFQGVVSNNGSAGSLTKSNSGTLVLSGANTYTGSTVVNGGTLRRGSATSVPTGAGQDLTVATGATFDSNSFNLTVGGVLTVNGAVTNSPLTTISSGGKIGGNGTINALTIASGATLAPGNSIGQLNVTGALIVSVGSTYAVEVAPDGTSDNVAVTGSATLQGGTVAVTSASTAAAFPTTPSTYTILTATTGVTGTFASIDTSALAFFTGALDYATPNTVKLVLTRNDVGFGNLAKTPNEMAAANGITSLGTGNPLYAGILGLSATQVPQAFGQLSGEGFATANGELAQFSSNIRNVINDRIDQAFSSVQTVNPSNYAPSSTDTTNYQRDKSAWVSGYGQWRNDASNGNAALTTSSGGGAVAGFDNDFGNFKIGGLVGYGQTGIVISDRNTKINTQDFSASAYAGTEFETMQFAMGAAYTRHLFSSTRNLTLPTVQTLTASYQGATTQAFGEISKGFKVGATTVTPFGSLAVVNVSTDGFTETGGNAALTVASSSTTEVVTTLGLRGAASFVLDDGMLVRLIAGAGWQHSFASTPLSTNNFANGTQFGAAGLPIAADAARVQLGLDVDANDAISFGAKYDGQYASNSQSHRVTAEVTGKF